MKKISEVQWREVGVILALILILIGLAKHSTLYYKIAFVVLLLSLILPILFKPFAFAWFAFGYGLSKISSTIILSVVYLVILLPIAFIMKLMRRDVLKLKDFKKGTHSVFAHRGHRYSAEDVLNPY